MVPTRLLAVPLVFLLVLLFYLAYQYGGSWPLAIIPVAILLALLYVFSPQINWWWWQRHPPDLTKGLQEFFHRRHHYYQRLGAGQQKEFRRRVFLFIQSQDFMAQGMDEVLLDIKAMVASGPVQLTFGFSDFLLPPFEHVVVYPHRFPSPQYEEIFHSSEIYPPDGVVMFCTETLVRGVVQPRQYLDQSLYEYARAFRHVYPDLPYPAPERLPWELLEKISGFSRAAVERWIGLPDPDPWGLCATYFFCMPENFQRLAPDVYNDLRHLFRQDPLQPHLFRVI